MSARAWAGPIVVGLVTFATAPFVGWWTILILIGFVIGYADPWDSRGNPR